MSDWSDFLSWARRFADEVDLDAEERNYKLVLATRLHEVTDAVRRQDAEWLSSLGRALRGSNLVPWHFADSLLKCAETKPLQARDAVLALVDAADPVAQFDTFAEAMKDVMPSATPGDLAALGAALLMSKEAQSFPPYSPELVGDWAARVGSTANASTASQRYQTLIDLCDELVAQANSAELPVRDRLDAQGLAWTVLKQEPPVRWTPLDQAHLVQWRSGIPSDEVGVARGTGWSPPMESATWEVLGRGLQGKTSAIAPHLTTWDPAVAEELQHRIEDTPDFGLGTFMTKLEGQLSGASDEVIVLAAELIYIHSAPLTNVRPKRKRERLTTILGWTEGQYELPTVLDAGLEAPGAFNGGIGFNVQMWNQLTWLCRFLITWTAESMKHRAIALRDPFEFSALAANVPKEVNSIRYSLEYLAWPGVFPPVASSDHRRLILKWMVSDIGGPSGTDDMSRSHDLVSLRQWHERKVGTGPVEWYEPPYVERWFPNAQRAPRAWLIRPGDGGSELVESWLADGFMSLSAKMLGTVAPGSPERLVAQAVKGGYTHLDASQRQETTAASHSFLTVVKENDIVATIEGGRLFVGTVNGPARYVDVTGSRLRRDVLWTATPVEQNRLEAPLPSLLDQQGTVVDATAAYDILAELLDATSVDPDEDPDQATPAERARPATTPKLPAVTEPVASSLHMDRVDLQEIVDLLQRRQQIVLYGPPGTGKTYVARELARHLVGDPSRVRLVQFHPSYSYEDFFEGYRPVTEDGQATFALKDGPLRLLAAEAKNPENRENAYILIIDEMNRANLAKVFGELYFLLEYRKETVRLQYRPDEAFFLPPNLFIIGTMNTADRSIALVDAAIRRRFPFYEMHPSEEPVKSVLERYLSSNNLTDGRAALLTELNRRMGEGGRDLQIGPSYLMRPEIRGEADIDLVWKYDVLPLLDEHFYGERDRETIRSTFGLDALRKAVARGAANAAAVMNSADEMTASDVAVEVIDLSIPSTMTGGDESV